ncbi:MAG: pyridoxal 5'-phosphate synthase glutaminase subunit PdxT [Oscillospiraceae bacterium]|nr:pyridoxal 5'-phosphate synthase glutaminase subunit PdxT [Oscillospiraceae bacterium]
MTIGILSVQGAFIEHEKMLDRLGVESIQIRNKADLSKPIHGMILPGGESTVMGKLLHDLDMMETIRQYIRNGLPVFGTRAGTILLAKNIVNSPAVHLGTMDIAVLRNAYGRQLGSFHAVSSFDGETQIPMTFIRAPYIENVGEGVKILSTVNGNIVAAQQDRQLVTSFHPELTGEMAVHQHFLNIVERSMKV